MEVVTAIATAAGLELRLDWRVPAVTGVLGLVAAGQGYGIVPEATARLRPPGVSFRPLHD